MSKKLSATKVNVRPDRAIFIPGNAIAAAGVSRSSAFRPEIEGLRAIAIILVVAFHAAIPGFTGGYVGVDIFFVLSGYLITGLIVREIETTGTLKLRAFYARRARRLLPAMAVTLVAVVLLSALIYAPFEQIDFASAAITTAVYASNLYFAQAETNYFGADVENNPVLHTWSLSVEEQFYLVWPLFVMLILGACRWQKRPSNGRSGLLWSMAFVAVFSFALSFVLTSRRQPWAFFSSPTRAWEFAIGAFTVVLCRSAYFKSRIGFVLGWLGLAGILTASLVLDRGTLFPGIAVLLPALSTVAVLLSTTNYSGSAIVAFLSVRPMQAIGRVSYSWYLWHWPVLIFFVAIFPQPPLATRIVLTVLSLGVAVLSYRFVEDPLRRNRWLASRYAYTFGMVGLITILGVGLSLAWRTSSVRASQTGAQLRYTKAHDDVPISPGHASCMLDYFDVTATPCVLGADHAQQTVVLFGDSHAHQWVPALEPIAIRRNWKLVELSKAACPPVNAPFFYAPVGRIYSECGDWRDKALERIRMLQPALTVVTLSETYPFDLEQWRRGISSVVERLALSSAAVLIVRDTPRTDFDLPTCLAHLAWRPTWIPASTCQFIRSDASTVFDLQMQAAARFKNVKTADLSVSICPEPVCAGERDEVVVLRDSTHLTASFVKKLQSELEKRIDEVLVDTSVRQD